MTDAEASLLAQLEAERDTSKRPPPALAECPYGPTCPQVESFRNELQAVESRAADRELKHHQEVMRAIGALKDFQDTTEVRMERRRAIDSALSERIDSIEALARNAGGSAGRASGKLAANSAKWIGGSGLATAVAAVVWELLKMAGGH